MRLSAVVIFAASTLLVACGTLNNNQDPGKIALDRLPAGVAIVILSTGASEKCISTATFAGIFGRTQRYMSSYQLNVDGYAVKSDFQDHQGHLSAVILNPGDYYFAPTSGNPMLRALKVPKADFSVAAGEVVYLGEYFLTRSCAWSTTADFRDQYERDIAMLAERNPALAKAPIVKRILRHSGYAVSPDS